MAIISETQLLNYIRQNIQMGLEGIDTVEKHVNSSKFKDTLDGQKMEYSKMYSQADAMLRSMQGTPDDIPVMAKVSVSMKETMKSVTGRNDSKIAEDMIKGTTMGITKLTRHLHDYDGTNTDVVSLANTVITAEQYNVEQLKPFL